MLLRHGCDSGPSDNPPRYVAKLRMPAGRVAHETTDKTMSESILQIRPVKREAAKIVLGLCGPSGEGKTFSALLLALGLAGGDPSKVGLLDTENRRGSLYDDIFDDPGKKRPFLIGELNPPFSPYRYSQAMREFADKGVEALVVDSMSHEHEGEGGLEEIAHKPKTDGTPRKIADWITAKREHKRFMNTLLYLPCHVVCCFRAREKMDFKNTGPNGQPVSLGIQPVCEKNVLFEMTASFLLRNQGQERDIIKLPKCLEPILGGSGYLTVEHGRKLRDWVGGQDPVERARNILLLAASQGSEKLKEAWLSIGRGEQKALAAFKDTLKDTAASADAEQKRGDNGAPDAGLMPEEETWK